MIGGWWMDSSDVDGPVDPIGWADAVFEVADTCGDGEAMQWAFTIASWWRLSLGIAPEPLRYDDLRAAAESARPRSR